MKIKLMLMVWGILSIISLLVLIRVAWFEKREERNTAFLSVHVPCANHKWTTHSPDAIGVFKCEACNLATNIHERLASFCHEYANEIINWKGVSK